MKERVLRYRVFFQNKRPETMNEASFGSPWVLYMSFDNPKSANDLLTSVVEKYDNLNWKLVDANCNEYI